VSDPGGPVAPLSSDTTRYPAPYNTSRHTWSASRSTAYCPSRTPEAPQSELPASTAATASAARWNADTAAEYLGSITSSDGSVHDVAVIDVAGFVADLKGQAI